MEPHDIERLRRSLAMLPPGHTAGALTRSEAESLVEELHRLDRITARYRQVIEQLRAALAALEEDPL